MSQSWLQAKASLQPRAKLLTTAKRAYRSLKGLFALIFVFDFR